MPEFFGPRGFHIFGMTGGPEAEFLEELGVVERDALAVEALDEAMELWGEIVQIAACQQAPEMTVVWMIAVFVPLPQIKSCASDPIACGMARMNGIKRGNDGGPIGRAIFFL